MCEEYKMSAEEILKVIVEKNIQISPVIDVRWRKNKKVESVHWFAGYRTVSQDCSKQCIVRNCDFALGDTLEESIRNLLTGRTQYILVDGEDGGQGIIENPDKSVKRYR